MLTLSLLSAAWTTPLRPLALATVAAPSRSTVYLNAVDGLPYDSAMFGVGCICEFDAGKQPHSKGLLGIIRTAEVRRWRMPHSLSLSTRTRSHRVYACSAGEGQGRTALRRGGCTGHNTRGQGGTGVCVCACAAQGGRRASKRYIYIVYIYIYMYTPGLCLPACVRACVWVWVCVCTHYV